MKDPFVYENTNILINVMDLKDQELLDQYESVIFQLSFTKLVDEGFKIENTLDILKLHKELFNQVYAWAGTIRTINIQKQEKVLDGLSVIYGDKNSINNELSKLNQHLNKINVKMYFIKDLSLFISKIWQIHPFREGNTRTVVVFLYFLLEKFKLELNVDLLEKHSKYFRNALVLASIGKYSEYEHLESILEDAIFNKVNNIEREKKSKSKYESIKNLDLSNYNYNYHTKK